MDYLSAQQALYLAAAGLLGLALGWWLGRSRSSRAMDRALSDWQERLAASEMAHEEASQEVQRLAGQVSELNIEVEESRDKAVSLAANLGESERQLAGEREQAAELRSGIEERESKNVELASEISRWRQEAETLQQEMLVGQEDLRRAEDDLERERDQSTECEAATGRYERRIAALESAISTRRREEDGLREQIVELRAKLAGLDEEATRLRQVKLDFQQWMQDTAGREEELRHARQQIAEVDGEREVLATEVATLRSGVDRTHLEEDSLRGALDQAQLETSRLENELAQARLEASSSRHELEQARRQTQANDATAAASRGENRDLSEELARTGDRIRELEADKALSSRLAAEIEGLHTELASSVERERELTRGAQDAEDARAQAAEELDTLLNAPLVDVDRLASRTTGISDDESRDTLATTEGGGPELLEAPRGAADDLKRIRGIGPVLESLLNRLGVYHFRQITSWTSAEISWVASHVDTFPGRIERDGWTTQAAALRGERHGEEE